MTDEPIHKSLFTFLGVPWTVTGDSWRFVPPKLVIGIIAAIIALPDEPLGSRVVCGLLFGVTLLVILMLHIIGHIFSSKLVTPAMTEAYITPMLIETRYGNDSDDIPSRVHLIRSFGGPVMNILLGIVGLLIVQGASHYLLWFFAGANLVLAMFVLLPFPTVDGAVIWREVIYSLRRG